MYEKLILGTVICAHLVYNVNTFLLIFVVMTSLYPKQGFLYFIQVFLENQGYRAQNLKILW